MKRISSRWTFYMRKVFPVAWFGVLATFFVVALATGTHARDPMVLVVPVLMAAIGWLVFRHLVWDLADEVHDGGEFLLVRRSGVEARVPIADIVNVSMMTMVNPPRLSLRLRRAGPFGDEVVFSPTSGLRLNPFARNAVAEDLMRRVDQARGGQPPATR